jgi:hypothetical protein
LLLKERASIVGCAIDLLSRLGVALDKALRLPTNRADR